MLKGGRPDGSNRNQTGDTTTEWQRVRGDAPRLLDRLLAELRDEKHAALSAESSAWLAAYGTLPTAPTNRFALKVFDQYVHFNVSRTFHSYPALTGLLGMMDQVALQVVTDNVTIPGGTVSLTAQIQHAADGRQFVNKNLDPEVSNPVHLNPDGETAMEPGFDSGQRPSLAYVRIALALACSVSGPAKLRVQVHATCNDFQEKHFASLLRHRQALWEQSFDPILDMHPKSILIAMVRAAQAVQSNPDGSGNSC